MRPVASHSGNTGPTQSGAPTAGEPNPTALDLTNLMQRITAGDREALGELYDLTVSKVFALAQVILRNSADAEEVACDVYTHVWENAAQYQGGRGAVLGWLLVVCRSRALDLSRRNRTRARFASLEAPPTDEEPTERASPEEMLDLMEQGTAVHRALEKLTPMRRRLIALAFFQGLSHLEIAEKCNLPVGTVKSHIRRSLAALRAELAEGGNDATSVA